MAGTGVGRVAGAFPVTYWGAPNQTRGCGRRIRGLADGRRGTRPVVEPAAPWEVGALPQSRGDDVEKVLAGDGFAQEADPGQIDLGIDRAHQDHREGVGLR